LQSFVPLFASGVGHPDKPEPLAYVRGTDARSAEICRPCGVARLFQVSEYSVEPREPTDTRNLFSKYDWRAALLDEAEPDWPEVALVVEAVPASCDGEGLAGAATGPDGAIVWPSCEAEGMGPSADSCEEMTLSERSEVRWGYLLDGTGVDDTVCNEFF